MRNIVLSTLIVLFTFTACSSKTPQKLTPVTQEQNRTLTIDLDKEVKSETDLRGKETLMIDSPIYIGDNDEVSFIGDIIEKESPIQVKIGDNDEVAFNGREISIKTMELHNGDIIQMRGQSGNVFLEVEVLK
jgi:uncharacterized protein YcfL